MSNLSERLTADGTTFRLPPGLAPDNDIAWHMAGDYGRKLFWIEAGRVGKDEWTKDTVLGIGPRGKFREISESYRLHERRSRMDETNIWNPPLTPARNQRKSRIISYLRYRVEPQGVMYYWIFDHRTMMPWGFIMASQAARKRDMMGFTKRAIEAIRKRMQAWWMRNRIRLGLRGQLMPVAKPATLDITPFSRPTPKPLNVKKPNPAAPKPVAAKPKPVPNPAPKPHPATVLFRPVPPMPTTPVPGRVYHDIYTEVSLNRQGVPSPSRPKRAYQDVGPRPQGARISGDFSHLRRKPK